MDQFGALVGGAFGRTKGGAIQSSITDFCGGGKSPNGDNIPFNQDLKNNLRLKYMTYFNSGGITDIDIPGLFKFLWLNFQQGITLPFDFSNIGVSI